MGKLTGNIHDSMGKLNKSNPKIVQRIWEKTNGVCWYCGAKMQAFLDFTIDHILPRCAGGGDEEGNLAPCCSKCNSMKGTKILDQFRWYLTLKKNGVPKFSSEQIIWLRANNFDIYKMYEPIKFYFETL